MPQGIVSSNLTASALCGKSVRSSRLKYMKPDISIIIPAYNEEDFIGDTLKSVFNSDFTGTYEVIVVCNGCTDKTAQIAGDTAAKVFSISTKGTPEAANYGAKQAEGTTLAFLDADSVISGNLLEEVLKAVNKKYIGGRTIVRWKGESLAAKIFSLVSYVHVHKWGGFCFVNKDIFDEVGGYRTGAKYGFDFDLARRVAQSRKVTLLHKSYIITSDRRFAKEGWWKHMWLAIKRNLIDDKIMGRGVKSAQDITYEDHR